MSVQLANELWNLVRDIINEDLVSELAESFVSVMLDQGYDLEDIRYEFDDEVIQDAIKLYTEEETEHEIENYDDDQESEW